MYCIFFLLLFSPVAQADWVERAWTRTVGPPGAAFVIIKGDSVFDRGGVGVTDLDRRLMVGKQTLFRAGSLGKTVVALGIFRLVEAGKLTLESRIDSILPDLSAAYEWNEELQVGHLLEHSSGLGDMRFNEYHTDKVLDLKSALAVNASSKTLRWSPGRVASYSNIGYAVLALVGERVSGQQWQEWIEDAVFKPLGMKNSGFGVLPGESDRTYGHAGGHVLEDPQYLYAPSLSFYTNVADWTQLLQCLLRQGAPILSPASVLRMESMRTTPAGRSGIEVGYGCGIQSDYVDGWLCRYHTGKIEGYTAVYEYYPAQNSGFAVFYNGRADQSIRTTPLVHACRSRCIRRQNLPDSPLFLKNPLKKIEPADFAGTYAFANPRIEVPGFYDEWMLETEVEWLGDRTFLIGGEKWFWIGSGRLVKSGAIHAGAVLGEDLVTGQRSLTIGKLYYLQGGQAIWRQAFRWSLWGISMGLLLWTLGMWIWKEGFRPGSWMALVFPIMAGEGAFKWMLTCDPTVLGQVSLNTVGIFILSLLVVAFTAFGGYALFRYARQLKGKWYYWPWVILGLLDIGFCWALWQRDLLGLALWAY